MSNNSQKHLLHQDPVFDAVPDQVQEGISRTDLLNLLLLGELVLGAFAWVDDEDHDDADEHGDECRGHVVNHGSHAHLP